VAARPLGTEMTLEAAIKRIKDATLLVAAVSSLLAAIAALSTQAAGQLATFVGVDVPAGWLWVIAAGSFAAAIGLLRRRGGSSVKDHEAFNIAHKYLEGREQDIDLLARALGHAPFIWLIGESGSGKSSLLDRGLRVRLDEDDSRFTIYLNDWGLDWVHGPLDALADAVRRRLSKGNPQVGGVGGPSSGDEALDLLGQFGKAGRLPVLLFDQAEDYLTLHRDHFTKEQVVVPVSTILAENRFWKAIANLLREDKVRCLFACRRDMVGFFESLRFRDPEIRWLAAISTTSAADLIAKIREVGVKAPENGFDQLTTRLLRDLDADGWVLPIQLRVALLGLSRLPFLTVSAYDAEGGLPGLEALYIRSEVAKAARLVGWDAADVRALLVAMVDRSQRPMVSSPMPIDSLLTAVPPGRRSQEELDAVLKVLRDADVVRASLDPETGAQVWQLDHDYLSRGVIELDRRARRSYLELEDSAKNFGSAAGLIRRWRSLLNPRAQIALVIDRLRRRFTYGPYRGFALLSTLRLLVHPTVAAIAAALIAVHFFSLLSLSNWSRGLAGASGISKDLDSRLLLAVAAQEAAPTAEAQAALLGALQKAPQLRTILHGQEGEALAFARHAPILASADADGAIRFWDTKSWSVSGDPVRAGKSRITTLAFSGDVLLSGDVEGLIRFWDRPRGVEARRPLPGGRGQVTTLALHPGGRFAVAGYSHGAALLWDLGQTPPAAHEFPAPTTATVAVWNPAGDRLALVDGTQALFLWDFAGGVLANPWKAPFGAGATALAWSPSGNLVVGGANGYILWLGEGAHTVRLSRDYAHEDQVSSLVFSDDGSLLASGGHDGKIMMWSATGEDILVTARGKAVRDLAFEPGSAVLVSAVTEPRIYVWDMEMAEPLARPVLRSEQLTPALTFSPDGRSLFAGTEDGAVQWIDLSGHLAPRSLQVDDRAKILQLDVAGDRLLWSDENRRFGLWDLASGHGESFARQASEVAALAIRDPEVFAIGGSDGRVTLWRRRGEIWRHAPLEQPSTREHLSSIVALAFDRDGRVLVGGDEAGRVMAWEVESGHQRHWWKLSRGVTDLAFSPDGRSIAVGTLAADGAIYLLHPGRKENPTRVETPCGVVEFLAFSRDGRNLRIECDGGLELLKLDAGSWRSTGTVQLTANTVQALSASPRDDVVAIMSDDSEGQPLVLIWDLDEVSWKRRACSIANLEMPSTLSGWTGLPAGRCKSLRKSAAPETAELRLDDR
jgi:WD40 repeat protein